MLHPQCETHYALLHFKLDLYPVITFMTKTFSRIHKEEEQKEKESERKRVDFTGLMRLTTARSTGGYANGTKH